MPGELLGGIPAPAEPALVVEPPEEDGDEGGEGGEDGEDEQDWELTAPASLGRYSVSRHPATERLDKLHRTERDNNLVFSTPES